MASTLVSTKVDVPTSNGTLLVGSSGHDVSPTSVSTTWLKLNSTAPIEVRLEDITSSMPENQPFSGATKLRHLLENTKELIVCPGVYDGLSARTAMEMDFKALYMASHMSPSTRVYQFNIFRLEQALRHLVWASLTLPSLS